jgi:hypothetical protein
MFVEAVKKTAEFTSPVTISTRTHSGTIKTACASYILINEEGWILTAAHVFKPNQVAQAHKQAFASYENQRQTIEQNKSLAPAKKRKLINRLPFDRDWIKSHSYWWGQDGVSFADAKLNVVADIAVARLKGLKLKSNQQFPRFGDPSKRLDQGQSLCKLGFPFHEIKSTFDDSGNVFVFEPESLPIPRFPLDGILTRYVNMQDSNTKAEAIFIEMSTPGLRGQSGGPVFDTQGVVWGIQTQTRHLPLGFQPTVQSGTKKTLEHQFLNVGLATYVSEIDKLFNLVGIKYDSVA